MGVDVVAVVVAVVVAGIEVAGATAGVGLGVWLGAGDGVCLIAVAVAVAVCAAVVVAVAVEGSEVGPDATQNRARQPNSAATYNASRKTWPCGVSDRMVPSHLARARNSARNRGSS